MRRSYILTVFMLLAPYILSAVELTPKLVVYASKSFASGLEKQNYSNKKLFESQCKCIVELKAIGGPSAILSRLMLEGKNSPADVAIGIDNSFADKAENLNIFVAHNINTDHLALPINWKSKYLIPYDYGYLAFIYDKSKLKNPPKSFEDLLNNPELKILVQDPRSSSIGFGLVAWLHMLYQDEAPEIWKQLKRNIVTITKNWTNSYDLFIKGNADLLLSYNTSPIYGDNIGVTEFKQGHYLQLELGGKLKSSKHPELADQFLRFILSPGFQYSIPVNNYMFPVVDIDKNLSKEYKKLFIPSKVVMASSVQVRNNRNPWIQEWLEALAIK